jgi:cysteinyl-tRNA synthetase
VLFGVRSWQDAEGNPLYGRLARRTLDEMIAGARVEVAPYKRDPMDFVLWKPSAADEPGWPSRWGRGRPGWHIECSAMAYAYLGTHFDIHGGGIDLVFPHHENELAQSCCAHGVERMAEVWMHNGFLTVDGEKMAKSAGNFVTVRDVLRDWPGEVVRLNLLKTHYRQPIDWTVGGLREAERTLDQWYEVTAEVAPGTIFCADFLEALLDDLNTPRALAALHEVRGGAERGHRAAAASLLHSARLLGLLTGDATAWREGRMVRAGIDAAAVERLIAARDAARVERDWAEADRLRDELDRMGVALKDGKDPATGAPVTAWEVKR